MSTNLQQPGVCFRTWIAFAFILGALVGFVVGAGSIVVLEGMTGYAPSPL